MKSIIRPAIVSDSPAIFTLIKELALFEKEPESVKLSQSDIEKYGFGTTPLFECLVAEFNNVVIGMALFYPRFSTWTGPTFHLEDLIVSEKFKEKVLELSCTPLLYVMLMMQEFKESNGMFWTGMLQRFNFIKIAVQTSYKIGILYRWMQSQ